ncbi:MAG: Ig-like domain-containing protein [Planctomycetia bacterium]
MKTVLSAILLSFLLLLPGPVPGAGGRPSEASAAPVETAATTGREIMGWVPPYGVSACKTAVTADFGAYDVKDALTRVGLQFWVPNTDGTLKYATHESYKPSDSDVSWWKAWAQPLGIKVLLTVYNNTGSWDWSLARAAFATNRATFVAALLAEVDRLGLDGVDVDFEAIGSFDADRAAFAAFINDLSAGLKTRGKLLTVDSFHYIWNAPNQSWWPDWVGKVDTVHPMGYDDLYEGGTSYHKYSFQQNTGVSAGFPASAIVMGFPTWVNSWGTSSGRGTTALAHVQEVRFDLAQPAGVALWDLQLTGSAWRDSNLWAELAALKGSGSTGNRTPTAYAQTVSTTKDTAVAITLTGYDADGNALTYAIATQPTRGTLTGTPPSVTYTPSSGWTGSDTFTFTVNDGQATSSAATVTVLTGGTNGPLPSGWSSADVGAPALAGSAAYDSTLGSFTLTGAGTGLSGSADQFRYAYGSLSGDGDILARVDSMGSGSTGLAGVMIREGTGTSAVHHFFGRRADGRLLWIRRTLAGKSTSLSDTGAAGTPVWVRLVRAGGSITAYRSADGTTWTRVNNAKASMATTVTAGLVVSSGSTSSLLLAVFSRVSLVP